MILEEALTTISRPADNEALTRVNLSGTERLISDLDPVAEVYGTIYAQELAKKS